MSEWELTSYSIQDANSPKMQRVVLQHTAFPQNYTDIQLIEKGLYRFVCHLQEKIPTFEMEEKSLLQVTFNTNRSD